MDFLKTKKKKWQTEKSLLSQVITQKLANVFALKRIEIGQINYKFKNLSLHSHSLVQQKIGHYWCCSHARLLLSQKPCFRKIRERTRSSFWLIEVKDFGNEFLTFSFVRKAQDYFSPLLINPTANVYLR